MWGGEPEMDAGAILLGVIVHMFVVPNRGGALGTARLNASFYPLTSVKENAEERKKFTKFIFIHQNDHFLFVRPMQPGAPRAAAPPPAPSLSAGNSIEDRAKLLRELRARNQGGRPADRGDKNAELKALARERERRAAAGSPNDGGACARAPATLTDDQRSQVEDDAAYALRIQELEAQSVRDAEMAQRLALQDV